MNNPHILYINADRGIPVWGQSGGSAHIRDFTEAAIQSGAKVTIVTARSKPADSSAPEADVHKIKFRRYGETFQNHWERCSKDRNKGHDKNCDKDDLAKEIRSFYANTILSQQLPDLSAKNNFSLVYERYSLFSFAGIAFAKSHNLPYVLEVNSPLIEEALLHRHLHMRELADSVANYLFTNANKIIAVSQEVANYIVNVSPTANVAVAPNAVNPTRFQRCQIQNNHSSSEDRTIATSLSHLEGAFTVGYLGSLRPWHGLNNLIEAFATFSKKTTNAHLLIIGDGKNVRPQLEAMCQNLGITDSVTFTGEAANADVPEYLSHCDTLVAPYPAIDNFYFSPLKVFEYMASGKPIIASDIGQISELFKNKESALLTEPGNIPELVEAMQLISADPQLAKRLATTAYDNARALHSWDTRMNQILQIFNELPKPPRVAEAI